MFFTNSSRLVERVKQFSVADPDVLSLAEMCSIRSGSYVKELAQIIQESKAHILDCKVSERVRHHNRRVNKECIFWYHLRVCPPAALP